jgi:hypothetical protein
VTSVAIWMHAPVRVEYNRPIDSVLLKVVFVFDRAFIRMRRER